MDLPEQRDVGVTTRQLTQLGHDVIGGGCGAFRAFDNALPKARQSALLRPNPRRKRASGKALRLLRTWRPLR
jgi:hypothetical protein